MNSSIFFQGGTLVLHAAEETISLPHPFQFIKHRWRCEAYHYKSILLWLQENHIHNSIPRWSHLKLKLHDSRELYDYQIAALDAWTQADKKGSVVLPTGSGKTLVALHAILSVNSSAVIVVPTLNLLYQWYTILTNAFKIDIGVYYNSEKHVLPITISTYHSAGDLMATQGNSFKLLLFDEVHHLPAKTWGETALMSPAPFRLGLTATYPEEHEQIGERWQLDDLIGPIVYTQRIEPLVGKQLAQYRTQRVRVDLTPDERSHYDAAYDIYTTFIRERALRRSHGPGWLRELLRLSAFDSQARHALLARQQLLKIVDSCEGKFVALENLLHEYYGERILIFTESNSVAYAIAHKYLIPVISHETGVAERKHILDAFHTGHYRAIVTSKVLNEGVDVPEAKVAIVLGGSSSKREYIQRLGRILRKKEPLQAVLVEVLARKTIEEGKAQRRHVQREIR